MENTLLQPLPLDPEPGQSLNNLYNTHKTAETKAQHEKTMFYINQYRTSPNKHTLNAAIQALNPKISKITQSITGGYYSPIIHRRATILTAKALQNYDEDKGKLDTYLYTNLMPLKRLAPQSVEPIKVPESIALDKRRLDEAYRDFVDMTGREPTDQELADSTNINIKRLRKVKATNMPVNEGMFTNPENPQEIFSPGVNFSGDSRDIDLLYHDLSDDDKQVYRYRTGYEGEDILDNPQIAERMGRDTKWVSQRASKIQERVNNVLGRA